jgi:decaprenylphospho-beta-D-erythro-pentofuranosid-2-ulose 2-reductase
LKDALGSFQSVLLLGGTSEIGLAIAEAVDLTHPRKVVLAARDEEKAAIAARPLKMRGADVSFEPFDAGDLEKDPEVLDGIWSRHGDFDLVIVAFGVLGDQTMGEEHLEHSLSVLRTNGLDGALATLGAAAQLKRQGHGTLVVLSSVASERARRSNFIYGASKASLDAVAQGLSMALEDKGVHVLVVRPGFVHSKMTDGMEPAPFATTPAKVAEDVVAALRRGATTVWSPGILRWVMGAIKHVPRPLFKKLPL